METPTCSHRETTEHGRDLSGREALPLRQEQNLAICRPEPAKGLVHQRLLGGRLLRNERGFEDEPLVAASSVVAPVFVTPAPRNTLDAIVAMSSSRQLLSECREMRCARSSESR